MSRPGSEDTEVNAPLKTAAAVEIWTDGSLFCVSLYVESCQVPFRTSVGSGCAVHPLQFCPTLHSADGSYEIRFPLDSSPNVSSMVTLTKAADTEMRARGDAAIAQSSGSKGAAQRRIAGRDFDYEAGTGRAPAVVRVGLSMVAKEGRGQRRAVLGEAEDGGKGVEGERRGL